MKIEVPVDNAYRLLGNGPVVMVSATCNGKSDVMTNAWNCALDFNPSKILLVISAQSVTKTYAEQSGELIVNIPSSLQKDLLLKVGSSHGDVCDKFDKYSIKSEVGSLVKAPMISGCLAWLECKVIKDEHLAKYDLVACEIVRAWAEDFYFKDNKLVVSNDPKESCIHHAGDANFYTMGKLI